MATSSGLPLVAALTWLFVAPAYGDTIYTCKGKSGAEVLQNMPCDSGSQVSVQNDMRAATDGQPAPGTAQGAPRTATAADVPSNDTALPDRPQPQSVAPDVSGTATDTTKAGSGQRANVPNEPELGMTQQQVRAILGLPSAVTQEEASQGIEMTWIYGDSRVLQFDATGRLSKK
jgi:hypothetical protein